MLCDRPNAVLRVQVIHWCVLGVTTRLNEPRSRVILGRPASSEGRAKRPLLHRYSTSMGSLAVKIKPARLGVVFKAL